MFIKGTTIFVSDKMSGFQETPIDNKDLSFTKMTPSRLFRWFLFEVNNESGLDDHGWYASYADRPEQLDYIWEHYDRRLETLRTRLTPNQRVLEVGSGHGIELLWMALQGCDVTGIEPVSYLLEDALKRKILLENVAGQKLQCKFIRKSLLDMDEEEKFDLIYMREAFHHIEPRNEAVRKLANLLEPDGMLIISEANAWNLALQIQLFFRRGFKTIVHHVEPDGRKITLGNERILTPMRLNKLFGPFGITGRCNYMRLLPTVLARNPVLRSIARFLEYRFNNFFLLRPFFIHYEWIGTYKGISGTDSLD